MWKITEIEKHFEVAQRQSSFSYIPNFEKIRASLFAECRLFKSSNILGVTQLIACCQIRRVLSLFSISKNNTYGMLWGEMHVKLKLIFIIFFNYPDVFLCATATLLLQLHAKFRFFEPTFWLPLMSLIIHSKNQSQLMEIIDQSLFFGKI